jgi:hypothetical protein
MPTGSNTTFFTPGGPYFVLESGTIQRQSNPVLAEALVTAGAVGFPTQTLAKAFAASDSDAAEVNTVANAAESVPDFLHRLTESNTWIRVVEVLFGGVLVTVAVTHMLKPPVQGAVKAGGDFSSLIKLVAK